MKHIATLFTLLLLATPLSAHHSDAGLDMSSIVTVDGTVTEFAWRNPHIYIEVETTDEQGESVRWEFQMGVPSGNQKHVVERYRLIEDGARLLVELTLEDPEYLVGSMTHSRELIYPPQLPLNRWDCDPESTSRFVPQ